MTPLAWPAPLLAVIVVSASMALEAWRSATNERWLLQRGARLVPDPSFPSMRVAYPLGFAVVMAEGWWRGAPWSRWALIGMSLLLLGKAVKLAAIVALGRRWSFRVLVQPGEPLVVRGVYAWLRHPNYVGVAGEVIGIGVWMQAPITGTLFAVTFGSILLWRIRVEECALALASRR